MNAGQKRNKPNLTMYETPSSKLVVMNLALSLE